MKRICLILALLILTSALTLTNAQSFETILPKKTVWEGSSSDKLKKISDNQFALLLKERKKLKLKSFNSQLELLYEVELDGSKYFPEMHYDSASSSLIVFSTERVGSKYRLRARAFRAESGELLNDQYLYEGKELPKIDCQFNDHFFAVNISETLHKEVSAIIYDYAFEKVDSIDFQAKKNEKVLDFCFDQEGHQYVITYNKKAESIQVTQIDSLEQSIGHLTFYPRIKKLKLDELHAVPLGEDQLALMGKLSDRALSRFDLYHADMAGDTVSILEGDLLRKDSLKQLYEGLSVNHSVNGKPKAKRILDNVELQDIIVGGDGAIYLISEQIYQKTRNKEIDFHKGDDILISKFDLEGGNLWNTVIPRNAKFKTLIVDELRGGHNVEVRVFLGDDQLYVVTTERKASVKSAYFRSVDLTTGVATEPKLLKEGKYITNQNYTELLGDNMVLLISDKVSSLKRLLLQSIELKELL